MHLDPREDVEPPFGLAATVGLAAIFAAVALLAALDVVTDFGEGASGLHLALESALAIAGLLGLAVALRAALRLTRRARSLERQLTASTTEAVRWRAEARELLAGLGAAIDTQFNHWGLTPAESEVALLLLKGLSHKEVAAVRAISDATARQQAAAVYRKAGLSGRADLSAFFLEDLVLPQGAIDRADRPAVT
jgi:DNA-binding CsgD family transcriptional regulator